MQTEERKRSGKTAKKADSLINDQISNSVSNSVSNSNFSSKKKKHYRNSRSFLSNPEEIDKIYQNLKKTKLNEEFERREKQTEGSNLESTSSKYIDTETIENNIYKRIINISLSLVPKISDHYIYNPSNCIFTTHVVLKFVKK